jgi:hypothetical protein
MVMSRISMAGFPQTGASPSTLAFFRNISWLAAAAVGVEPQAVKQAAAAAAAERFGVVTPPYQRLLIRLLLEKEAQAEPTPETGRCAVVKMVEIQPSTPSQP